MRLASVALVCALSVGCVDRGLTRVDPAPNSVEKKYLPTSLNGELDLLFVIDNSGSMAQEHLSLQTRFPELITAIDELGPRRPDLHIGVVTSDMGMGQIANADFRCGRPGGDGGRLHGCASVTGTPYISDVAGPNGTRITNYSGTLGSAFTCIADVGDTGCSFEQHLASMQAALSPGINPGFLRRSATLAVIILADEDDCSADNDQLFSSSNTAQLGPLSDFRCFEHGIECDPVADPRAAGPRTNCRPRPASPYLVEIEQYTTFLRGLKDDPDKVFVAAIVGDNQPVTVGAVGGRPTLEASCNGGLGSADPAIRIGGLIDAFAGRSDRETICTGDLSAALRRIGDQLPPPVTGCFDTPPYDFDLSADGVQAECSVVEVSDPDGPTRAETPLGECKDGGTRPCWRIIRDPACTQTAEHWSLDIDRVAPAPAGAYLDVQCVVSVPIPPPI